MENIEREKKVGFFFERFMTSQMENLDKLVNQARKNKVLETQIERLEKSFDEFSETCNKLFDIHRGEFSIKLAYQAIPDNLWVRLHKKALEDPEIKAHLLNFKNMIMERGIPKEAAQQIAKDLDKKIKGVDYA